MSTPELGSPTQNSSPREIEEQLREQIQRLQVLHEIDHAALSAQSERETAIAALRYIAPLVAGFNLGIVYLWDGTRAEVELLASCGELAAPENTIEKQQIIYGLNSTLDSDSMILRKSALPEESGSSRPVAES